MYYIYALYNRENDKIYIGQTKNLEERIELHRSKKFSKSYTARFTGEWELFYKEEAESRKSVMIREKQLKSYRGREFLKQLVHPL